MVETPISAKIRKRLSSWGSRTSGGSSGGNRCPLRMLRISVDVGGTVDVLIQGPIVELNRKKFAVGIISDQAQGG